MFPESTVNVTGKKSEEGDNEGGNPEQKQEIPKQEVYVLDGGFVKWQEKWVTFILFFLRF